MAESIFSANVCSCRERKRAYNDAVRTSAGTASSIALAESPSLSEYSGFVQDSGEGRWTIQAAIDEAVPAEVLTASLYARFRSRQEHTFAEKMLSAMRQKFGGHVEPKKQTKTA
jgi:6-phosphogluconate dehydrogenase (decarboxylating)